MSNYKLAGIRLFLTVATALIAAFPGTAQTVTGSVSGTVTDPNGGIVPGSTVTLTNKNLGDSRVVTTNEEGRFTFAAVQPGTYTVMIEHQGFQKLLRDNTILSANENLALGELALSAGSVSETVTVTSGGATVELETSDLTARLTSDQIDLISTKGRDITSLLRLIPGTTNENDIEGLGEGFGTDLPFISGQRGRSTVPTVDGLNAGEPSGSNKLSMTINIDAIAEVKILRNNYAAEYGNNGGAIINIVSKGGGKDYRGSAYYFLRNEALNANQFFNNKAGLPKPLYRHNYWGFNFGGPLPLPTFGTTDKWFSMDKLFFFFSYERPHQISPTNPIFVTVPTELERAGDFSRSRTSGNQPVFVTDPTLWSPTNLCQATPSTPVAGTSYQGACFRDPSRATPANPEGMNIIPMNRFNPSTAAFLRVFPMPNVPEGSLSPSNAFYNFVTQKSVDVPKRSAVIRLDFKPTSKDSFFWKRQWWTSDNLGLGTSGWPGGDENRWGLLSHYLYKDNGWVASWAHVFNASIVNEFNFGMRRDIEGFIPGDGIVDLVSRENLNYTAPQLFPENNRLGTIPKVTNFSGVRGTPALINWLDRWGEVGNDFVRPSFSDNVTYNRGNHSFKFGMYFERLLNGEAAGSSWAGVLNFQGGNTGNWQFSSGNTGHPYANALIGNFRSYTETEFRPHTNIEQDMVQWYAQDQWKVSRRLSLNYGVRFGWHTPFYQRDNIGSSFEPSLFDPARAAVFYVPWCTSPSWNPETTVAACPSGNRVGVDPRLIVNGTLPPGSPTVSTSFIRSLVPNSGDILNGLQLARDPNTPKGYRIFERAVDIEPRVGFAYDITGKAKTVVRGMFGVYHTPRAGGGTTGDLTGNPPEQRTWTIESKNIANLPALLEEARANNLIFPYGAIRGLEKQTHTPEIYNFSFGVQHEIGWGTVVEASYVGSRARWLGEQRNINAVPDGARFVNCSVTAAFNVPCHSENRDFASGTALSSTNPTTGARSNDFLRPYVGYGDINFVTFSGNSRYDSLQVQVNRRYATGFQYGIAYTWSKSVDYTSDDRDGLYFATGTEFGGRDYRRFNFSPSDFDQRHVFTINYIWDIPFFNKVGNGFVRAVLGGWQLSGTTSFATGKPKDITASYDGASRTISSGQACPAGSLPNTPTNPTSCTPITDFTGGSTNALPFVTCDPSDFSGTNSEGTPLAFNPNCFSRPTRLGDIGDPARNVVRRPSIFNTDIALFKNIRWGERRAVQLRWETYNVFNRANFSDIDANADFELVQINPGAIANPGLPPPPCTATNICTAEFQQVNQRFGAVSNARSPRVMQASIKINF